MESGRIDVSSTFGALLVGGLVAATFTGVVTVQAGVYCRMYSRDRLSLKLLVFTVWFLDASHMFFVSASLWDHFISHFGEAHRIDYIPWSLALTIAFTAALTFLVHCFFINRIFKLSLGNWYIAIPLTILAGTRLAFACLTTIKMITLRSLHAFVLAYTWSFTAGLSISCLLDVLITAYLCYLLMRSQKETSSLNHILDRLMLYAFENGALTTAAACISLICWLTMPTNLIFMGLHFVISKFYANSLLATLNRRRSLQAAERSYQASGASSKAVAFATASQIEAFDNFQSKYKPAPLHINVQTSTKTMEDEHLAV